MIKLRKNPNLKAGTMRCILGKWNVPCKKKSNSSKR